MPRIKLKDLVKAEVIIGRDNISMIEPLISSTPGTSVILDFEGIESISSPFAQSLLQCLKSQTSVAIENASPHVTRMLDVVRARARVPGNRNQKRVGRVVIHANKKPSIHLENYINATL
jgi:hypothetical protein